MRIRLFLCGFWVIALSAASTPAAEPYARLVRISYVEGHVSFQSPLAVDWSQASLNMPLQARDRLYTGEDGRAEIEFDDGSVLQLAEKTDIELLNLEDDLIQIRVLVGLVTITVQSQVSFEINTPALAFNTLEEGVYRFDVREEGTTDGIVRQGKLVGASQDFSRSISSGELLHATPGDQKESFVARYDGRDEWDEWTDRRTADRVAYESREHVPDHVAIGVNELDQYGRWMVVENYGSAWVPRVDAGWSPYGDGRWCYRPVWGWTWVSFEPWGWLPYHYGRWNYQARVGWHWLPGSSFNFHFWSPGLVRFYKGPGWVSWYPLGPGDYYNANHYYYRPAHRYYLNNVRLAQRRGPGGIINRRIPGAVRTMDNEHFVNGGLRGGGRTRLLDGGDSRRGGTMVSGRLDLQPNSNSYRPFPHLSTSGPNARAERAVVVRTLPSGAGAAQGRYVRINSSRGTPIPSIRSSEDRRSEKSVAGTRFSRSATRAGGEATSRTRRLQEISSLPRGNSIPALSTTGGARGQRRSDSGVRGKGTPSIIRGRSLQNREGSPGVVGGTRRLPSVEPPWRQSGLATASRSGNLSTRRSGSSGSRSSQIRSQSGGSASRLSAGRLSRRVQSSQRGNPSNLSSQTRRSSSPRTPKPARGTSSLGRHSSGTNPAGTRFSPGASYGNPRPSPRGFSNPGGSMRSRPSSGGASRVRNSRRSGKTQR